MLWLRPNNWDAWVDAEAHPRKAIYLGLWCAIVLNGVCKSNWLCMLFVGPASAGW